MLTFLFVCFYIHHLYIFLRDCLVSELCAGLRLCILHQQIQGTYIRIFILYIRVFANIYSLAVLTNSMTTTKLPNLTGTVNFKVLT